MQRTEGTTLIETILALAILAVVTIAVVSLLAQISSLANSARLHGQAVAYMEQNLEKVRGYYQKNLWTGLAVKNSADPVCSSGCYTDGSLTQCMTLVPGGVCLNSGSVSCTNGWKVSDSGIHQSVIIIPGIPNASSIQVESWVAWLDKGKCRRINSKTYYYNY